MCTVRVLSSARSCCPSRSLSNCNTHTLVSARLLPPMRSLRTRVFVVLRRPCRCTPAFLRPSPARAACSFVLVAFRQLFSCASRLSLSFARSFCCLLTFAFLLSFDSRLSVLAGARSRRWAQARRWRRCHDSISFRRPRILALGNVGVASPFFCMRHS